MHPWRLRDRVFAAEVCGDLVFLDANTNAYLCLPRSDAAKLLGLLSGQTADAAATALVEELVDSGILEPASEGAPLPVASSSAEADFHDLAAPHLKPGLLSWFRLASAACETWFKLYLTPPRRWFRTRAGGRDVAASRACTLALQFDRMRPFFPRTGRCLPKSMLLLAYLRRHGIVASWVFGVRTFPFEAHCWVEYRGAVLSDTLEHVRWYTPIAAV